MKRAVSRIDPSPAPEGYEPFFCICPECGAEYRPSIYEFNLDVSDLCEACLDELDRLDMEAQAGHNEAMRRAGWPNY